jgi:hypothetical protein
MLRIILLSFLIVGCGVQIIQYTSPKAAYGQYKSYFLVTLKGDNLKKSSNKVAFLESLESAIISEMSRRDYKMDSQNPDLLIRYELISSTQVDTKINYSRYSYDNYATTKSHIESILLVELVDSKTKKLVWQASLDLKNHSNKKKNKDPIRDAIIKLFDTYLYRAGKPKPDQSLLAK